MWVRVCARGSEFPPETPSHVSLLGTMWVRCGYDVGTMWVGCGYDVGTMWVRCGYDVGIQLRVAGECEARWMRVDEGGGSPTPMH